MVNIRDEIDNREKSNINQNKVQMWFRAPKIWDSFLKKKAHEEDCSTSDLLRHAFRLTYGRELKEFRVNPGIRTEVKQDKPLSGEKGKPSETLTIIGNSSTIIPYDIQGDQWIESIVAFIANKRSPQTHRVYRLILKQFFIFADKHPSKITQSDIIKYRHHLEHLKRASSTINQHLAALSGYYTFCISRNLTIYNPVKGINKPSVNAYTTATWLDKNQAKALLSQPDRQTVKGKRDYAILLTLILTGLRRSELTNIRRGDIRKRGDKLYLTYNCKGRTKVVRDIPLRCWEAIEDYLINSGRKITDDSPLFMPTTDAGERLRRYYGKNSQNGHHPITPEAIRQMVVYYSRRAFGGGLKVSPHTLRHTAGTLLRKSGRSIEEVQSFLKHKRVDTTRRYLHVVEGNDSENGERIARMLDL